MRDIRFRAYIKDINDIVPVKNIDFYKELVKVDAELPYDGVLKLDEVELMQYTGLKDKNGTEVYESDIVIKHNKGFKDRIRFIGFSNASFTYTNMPKISRQLFNTFSIFGTQLGSDITRDWEVIGNIYENPELLKALGRTNRC